ncbi:MAG: tyrosine-type recombinase/integrase [Planctomycetes bacterium]|nr:tyrosine-type recombinase/integrase [Planctomycetota bacterium]
MAKKRPGPKATYVIYGNEVIAGNESIGLGGLSRESSNRQHYCYYTDPKTAQRERKKFSVDPDKAMQQYEALAEKLQGQKTFTLLKDDEKKSIKGRLTIRISDEIFELFEKLGLDENGVNIVIKEFVSNITIDETTFIEDLIWKKARELIIRDPNLASRKIGIQEIAYLDDLKPKEKPLTLKKIGDWYLKRREGFEGYDKKFSETCWDEFTLITEGATTIDLNAENIERYEDTLWEKYTNGIWAAKTLDNRFVKVRAVMSYVLKDRKSTEAQKKELRRILDLCIFTRPEADEIDPNPIEPEDLRTMLEVAKRKNDTRAILCMLLAANGAYLPKELGDIETRHLDLKNKTIIMNRLKTSKRTQRRSKMVPRACYLWDRTIAAIKAYQQDYPHQSKYLIVNENGGKLTRSAVGNIWYRIRTHKKTNVDSSVQFKHIRSGCRQAAAEMELDGDQKIKYLMGQRSVPAVDDHYLKRRKSIMKDFCLGIEKYFFGKEKST